ncbi:hypothetical protein EDD63_101136 [Breznakia blatticola]|uniref:Lipoprotein n=1 Tax=Breznakia blatticola TaxID=1754012 RepID=A0A4R8A9M4_9FIRM|nr:hypothetical protein [Breznakia blatticola]TDW26421.1 hypothetical protein EDD63_101136 [Breznakia blatticola]
MKIKKGVFIFALLISCVVLMICKSDDDHISLFLESGFEISANRWAGNDVITVNLENKEYKFNNETKLKDLNIVFLVNSKSNAVITLGKVQQQSKECIVYTNGEDNYTESQMCRKEFDDLLADIGISNKDFEKMIIDIAKNINKKN